MSLDELLKSRRCALGMTLDDVAEAAGISKSHLHGLEGDKCEPGITVCVKLSVALGTPLQLMGAAVMASMLISKEQAK
jgi:DNA-binding XRE family transcriptional regulator